MKLIGEMMSDRKLLLRFLFLVFGGFASFSGTAALATPSLTEDVINLSSSELNHDQALTRLRNAKRDELIATVRGLLKQSASQAFAVRAVSDLGLKELGPDVEALIQTTDSIDVVQVADISQTELHAKLQTLLGRKKNSALKSAVIGKISEALTDDEFSKLIADPDFLVRESVVSQFFDSLGKVPPDKRTDRFRRLLTLKPFQARESAMNLYERSEPKLKASLRPAWQTVKCEQERLPELKSRCKRLREEIQK